MKRQIWLWLIGIIWSGYPVFSQNSTPQLVGYWHNWNDDSAPMLPLNQVDDAYDIICVAFATPASNTHAHMTFEPEGITPAVFAAQISALQNQGKKVLISIGGATGLITLDDEADKLSFINSMNLILSAYPFDGIDIDIEHGNCITIEGGNIKNPAEGGQTRFIAAIKTIMQQYRTLYHKKMMLTAAPETAYLQGGMSSYGSIWGGYLPLLDALRDSIDYIYPQLYNSGTMYGLDGNIYAQGTADFIVAETEAIIQGFQTQGGNFAGFPASKIAVGLPACNAAAGGGYADTSVVAAAIRYLLGHGPQPGNYTLQYTGGYPHLGGMMTWSVNWDAKPTCNGSYSYARNYERIFSDTLPAGGKNENNDSLSHACDTVYIMQYDTIYIPVYDTVYIPVYVYDTVYIDTCDRSNVPMFAPEDILLYPNPANKYLNLKSRQPLQGTVVIRDLSGKSLQHYAWNRRQGQIDVSNLPEGVYLLIIEIEHHPVWTRKWVKVK